MIGARASLVLAAMIVMAVGSVSAASDEMLNRARDLYRNAAYDEALVVLDQMAKDTGSPYPVEAREYRLFSLIALGRKEEARGEIEKLVETDPSYQPSTERASPRVRATFKEVRQELLPAIVQRAYADAKRAFDRQDPESTAGFERVLTLLNDPDLASRPALADLRLVTTGFRDLSQSLARKPSQVPAATAPTAPPAPAASRSSAPSQPIVYREGDAGLVAPVPLNQKVPLLALAPSSRLPELEGVLELVIDENGDVISAVISTSIDVRYDRQLLNATKSWKYTPGRKDGKAVRVRKIVRVHVVAN